MIRVLGDRVLVALPPAEETQDTATGYTVEGLQQTASGLFVAKEAGSYSVERSSRGIVMQVGQKRGQVDLDDVLGVIDTLTEATKAADLRAMLAGLLPAPFDVHVGDCVLFPPSAGEQVSEDDINYVILREADILVIVEPKEVAA